MTKLLIGLMVILMIIAAGLTINATLKKGDSMSHQTQLIQDSPGLKQ